MKRFFFLFFVCMFFISANDVFAGGYNVSGTVKDDNNKSILAATISVLRASDSAWVKSELSEADGTFTIRDIEKGNYLLAVTSIGYKAVTKPLQVDDEVKDVVVVLPKDATVLNEVSVTGRRPYIETALGKILVNVPQASVNAGSTVLDLLRKSPGVTVDGNGNISMQGQGVLVMIDDKQTYLNGADLANYLKSMVGDQVAQLELITQPSAKYDAEGNAGIINIKLRKNNRAGWNVSVSLSAGQGVYPGTYNNLNLNYRKGKLNVYANGAYLHNTGFLRQQESQVASDPVSNALLSTETVNRFAKEVFEDYSLKTGVDYTVNDKLTAGCSLKGIYHTNTEHTVVNTTIADNVNNATTYNNAAVNDGFIRKMTEDNLYAKYTPCKGQEINLNLDYFQRSYKAYEDLVNTNYDGQYNLVPGGLQLREYNPSVITAYSAKMDYSGELGKTAKLEAGIKSSLVDKGAGAFFTLPDNNGNWINDTSRTNDFDYKEVINAAYVSGSKSFGSKWQAQLGLRAEHTNAIGVQSIGNQKFTRNYLDVFPTAFVSYKADTSNSFELNGGRRIDRPSYVSLNPFLNYVSQYSYSAGNPLLQPEYRNYVELKHNYKNVLFTSVGFSETSNVVNTVINYDAGTQTVVTKPENNASRKSVHVSSSFNKQLYTWWLLSATVEGNYQQYELNDSNYRISSVGCGLSFSNQFTLKDGWEIDTFYQYTGNDLQGISERDRAAHYVGLNIAKKIWKDAATIKLSANDPLDMYRYSGTTNWNGVQTTFNDKFAQQQFSLGFTYNFGKKLQNTNRDYTPDEAKRM